VSFSYEHRRFYSLVETGSHFFKSFKSDKRLLLVINYPNELKRLPFIYLNSDRQVSFFLRSIYNVWLTIIRLVFTTNRWCFLGSLDHYDSSVYLQLLSLCYWNIFCSSCDDLTHCYVHGLVYLWILCVVSGNWEKVATCQVTVPVV